MEHTAATPLTDHDITNAMIAFGGSFVSGLGMLFRRADVVNKGRLKDAFPDYWEIYRDPVMHQALAKRDGR